MNNQKGSQRQALYQRGRYDNDQQQKAKPQIFGQSSVFGGDGGSIFSDIRHFDNERLKQEQLEDNDEESKEEYEEDLQQLQDSEENQSRRLSEYPDESSQLFNGSLFGDQSIFGTSVENERPSLATATTTNPWMTRKPEDFNDFTEREVDQPQSTQYG